jgi:transposase
VTATDPEIKNELARLRRDAHYWESLHARAIQKIGRLEQKHSKQLSALRGKLKAAHEKLAKLKERIAQLRALVKLRAKQAFGKKSERRTGRKKGEKKKKGPTKGHGRRGTGNLPITEGEPNDIPKDQKCCSRCGKERCKLDDNISDTVEVEVRGYVRRVRSPQYAKTCQCPDEPSIVSAPAPKRLIPNSTLGISIWVLVLLDKYLFQRPTYRLLSELRVYGISLARSTLTEGIHRIAPLLKPVADEILARVRAATFRKADETGWPVFVEVEGKTGHRWQLWTFLCEEAVYFKLAKTRSSLVVGEVLGEEVEGFLLVDRYSAYKAFVLRCGKKLLLAFCWAHVRRDFLTIEITWPEFALWAHAWVDRIDRLWKLNDLRRDEREANRDDSSEKAAVETQLKSMKTCFSDQLLDSSLSPVQSKALKSLGNHWDGLTRFVEFPEIPMDNNESERTLRNPVVGRKGYYGSRAEWAGEFSADAFSVFQTLERNEINPRLWLTDYLEVCAENGGRAPEDITAYLPWNLSDERRAAWSLTSPAKKDEPQNSDSTGPPILRPDFQHRRAGLDPGAARPEGSQSGSALAANM